MLLELAAQARRPQPGASQPNEGNASQLRDDEVKARDHDSRQPLIITKCGTNFIPRGELHLLSLIWRVVGETLVCDGKLIKPSGETQIYYPYLKPLRKWAAAVEKAHVLGTRLQGLLMILHRWRWPSLLTKVRRHNEVGGSTQVRLPGTM